MTKNRKEHMGDVIARIYTGMRTSYPNNKDIDWVIEELEMTTKLLEGNNMFAQLCEEREEKEKALKKLEETEGKLYYLELGLRNLCGGDDKE